MSVRFPNVTVNRLLMAGEENMVASSSVCFVAKDITKKGRIPSLTDCHRCSSIVPWRIHRTVTTLYLNEKRTVIPKTVRSEMIKKKN